MTSVQEFNCIFCKEIFQNKEELQIHFRKHGDPNYNQNKITKRSNSEPEESAKPSSDQELVGCDVCTEVFPTISRAITHKHKVHPDHDAKYFCPWCGKLFTLKHLYNKHLESNHGEPNDIVEKLFHCDSCDIDFTVPTAMLYHNKFFHRQDTDVPELGQSTKLRAYNQVSIPIYYCAFCGEEYENKINLHKHKLDEHHDENQSPQEVLRCPLCQAVFYHLDAYELHLTFHSTDDLYSGTNEMAKDLTDYSLDTVPPLMEKVEDCQSFQAAETTVQEIDVNNLLELAIEETQGLKKSKKHKKHKKSKRSAITLDEFLNMNKDVFGEGIDIQGVEEVPTRAITKRLKVVNKPSAACNSELEKLKKQGIIIRKKLSKPLNTIPNMKTKLPQFKNVLDPPKPVSDASPKITSEEALSKLINQKNNQLKIVKKSSEVSHRTQNIGNVSENFPESLRMECDSTKLESGPSNGSENDDLENNLIKYEDDHLPHDENLETDEAAKPETNSTEQSNKVSTPATDDEINKEDSDNQEHSEINTSDSNFENDIQDQNILDSLNSADNKDESSRTSEMNPTNTFRTENNVEVKIANTINEHDNMNCNNKVENNTGKSIEALKYLSHLTIKSVNNNKNKESNITTFHGNETFKNPEIENKKDEKDKNDFNKLVNSSHSPLDAVKHLSGITVKSDNASSSVDDTSTIEDKQDESIENDDEDDLNDQESIENPSIYSSQNKSIPNKLPLVNNMKLGQNVTVKSVKHAKIDNDTDSETEFNNSDHSNPDDEDDDDDDLSSKLNDASQQIRRKILNYPSNKTLPNTKSIQSPKIIESEKFELVKPGNIDKSNDGTNLLKHLKHITAKPVNKVTNYQPVTNKTVKEILSTNQKYKKPIVKVERNEDNIEILNIDDSDSDEMEDMKTETKAVSEPKPIEALKHLNKNVTIKSVKNSLSSPMQDEFKSVPENKSEKDPINPKFEAIQRTLKNLGNNITVKSRNSSPSQPHGQPQNKNAQEAKHDSNEESDSDSEFNRVKITEMDDDENGTNDETDNDNSNVVVQTPDDSGSDNEQTNEDYDDNTDFESQIESNKVPKIKECAMNEYAKKFGKNITIKSTENRTQKTDGSANISQTVPGEQSSQKTSVFQKPNIAKSVQNTGRTVNQAMKQVTSNNQVKKEVTVQRFQTHTQTVIQEITTTVTKTIKTVNQEVRNTQVNQNLRNTQSRPMIIPQKVKGMNVNLQKNFEGVTVKQSTPNHIVRNSPIRPAIRKPIRPSTELVPINTAVRPSNQLVPVRPNLRLPSPRMPNRVRPSAPVMQGPRIGKPLKISPTAVIRSKRPVSEELSGPFSCFKRSKESLYPIPDGSSQFNQNDDANVEYASSSQVTKNFMSATKSVKGNSMVTSMQMKSETSTSSSYEINKLSNMSGLKITKMGQSKQVNEEKSQTDATKRTFDAIQKLQQQGLLVKKPKLDSDVPLNEDSDDSEGAADENVDYSSHDE